MPRCRMTLKAMTLKTMATMLGGILLCTLTASSASAADGVIEINQAALVSCSVSSWHKSRRILPAGRVVFLDILPDMPASSVLPPNKLLSTLMSRTYRTGH